MENRDKDKMSQRNSSTQTGNLDRSVSKDLNKSDSSVDFGKKIGQSEDSLNEPSSRNSGSIGSSGMESDSKSGKDLGSSKDSTWSDKGSQSGSRH